MNSSTANTANFYIVTSTDATEPAGFQYANQSAPTGAATKGFTKCMFMFYECSPDLDGKCLS